MLLGTKLQLIAVLGPTFAGLPTSLAFAWGDVGHETVALIAQHYLKPAVRDKVTSILEADTANTLTAHDIASAATWPDKHRESPAGRAKPEPWHFVDIEIITGDLSPACFKFPKLSPGQLASDGPANDCVIDKIGEFEAELSNTSTPQFEEALALKYLLHFVGDVHQPLHSADDNDRGGNNKAVSGKFSRAKEVHAFWDTTVVMNLGPDAETISNTLIGKITNKQVSEWSSGTAKDWAMEAYQLAKADAYGKLPSPVNGKYPLPQSYLDMATPVAAEQLSKAGVRLAYLLNQAFGGRG